MRSIEACSIPAIQAVAEAALFLRQNAPEPIRISDAADHVGYSPWHFSRLFEQATGSAPGEFLTAVRFQRSKELLLGGATVTEACHEAGFASFGTFSRRFAIDVGFSPSKFRVLPQLIADGGEPAPRQPGVIPVRVDVSGLAGLQRLPIVLVGLFRRGVARAAPICGRVVVGGGDASLPLPPSGDYRLLATALEHDDPEVLLVPQRTLAGAHAGRVRVRGKNVTVTGATCADAPGRAFVRIGVTPAWIAPVVTAVPHVFVGRLLR